MTKTKLTTISRDIGCLGGTFAGSAASTTIPTPRPASRGTSGHTVLLFPPWLDPRGSRRPCR